MISLILIRGLVGLDCRRRLLIVTSLSGYLGFCQKIRGMLMAGITVNRMMIVLGKVIADCLTRGKGGRINFVLMKRHIFVQKCEHANYRLQR